MPEIDKILKQCLSNNRLAQKKLFDNYKEIFMGIAKRYVKDHHLAKDVVQESFIKIFSNLDQLNEFSKFEIWAKRLVVNTSINMYRKMSTQPLRFDEIENGLNQYIIHDLSTTITPLSREQLIDLINKMPDGYRTIFNLYIIDGYSHKEISSILNITASTSRSQLTRARKYLQNLLKENEHLLNG